jgi:hypothetical protein
MFNVEIIDNDTGWKEFSKSCKDFHRSQDKAVGVGLFDNTSVIDRAKKNEFGDYPTSSRPWVIPRRSFLRYTYDNNKETYVNILKSLGDKIVSGKIKTKEALNNIGEKVKTDIVNFIDSDYYKSTIPNAPMTIAKKGSDHPLIDTGEMRDSIKYKRMSDATDKE